MAERMVNMIELGPRETGKSYVYKNLSYYTYMLSGGRATPATLFVHAGNGKPGLVAQFDTLVFDEIANAEFKDLWRRSRYSRTTSNTATSASADSMSRARHRSPS